MVRALARHEGLLVGPSSGAVVADAHLGVGDGLRVPRRSTTALT